MSYRYRINRAINVLADHWQRARDPPVQAALHAVLVAALPDALRILYERIAAHADGVPYARICSDPRVHAPSLSIQLATLRELRLVTLRARRYCATPVTGDATMAHTDRLVEEARRKGWTKVAAIPDRHRRYGGGIEIEATSPDAEFEIYIDAGADGYVEGFEISRIDANADGPLTSGRMPTRTVPTPEEAVGQWEDARARAVGS
jgi:hypothetical protein